jgi:hypothetical protein
MLAAAIKTTTATKPTMSPATILVESGLEELFDWVGVDVGAVVLDDWMGVAFEGESELAAGVVIGGVSESEGEVMLK